MQGGGWELLQPPHTLLQSSKASLASLGGRAELPVALSGSRAVKIWLLSCFLRLSYLISRIPSVDSDPGSFCGYVHLNLPLSVLLLPLPWEAFTNITLPQHHGAEGRCVTLISLAIRNVFESVTWPLVPLGTRKSEIWMEYTLLGKCTRDPWKSSHQTLHH